MTRLEQALIAGDTPGAREAARALEGEPVTARVAGLFYSDDQYLPGLVDGLSKLVKRSAASLTFKALFVFYTTCLFAKSPRSLAQTCSSS